MTGMKCTGMNDTQKIITEHVFFFFLFLFFGFCTASRRSVLVLLFSTTTNHSKVRCRQYMLLTARDFQRKLRTKDSVRISERGIKNHKGKRLEEMADDDGGSIRHKVNNG